MRHGHLVALRGERAGDGEPDTSVASGDEDTTAHSNPSPGAQLPVPTRSAFGEAMGYPSVFGSRSPRRVGHMRAIQITSFGGPEVLTLTDLPEPTAPDGFEVL